VTSEWISSGGVYHDRAREPRETVELVRPFFVDLGITRIARQTDLDCIGIPCFAAIRPNSRSIATNQGKGVSDDLAMASAVMEAVEYAVAERPFAAPVRASAEVLMGRGDRIWDARRTLPLGERLDAACEIAWLAGRHIGPVAGGAVMVPLEAVAMTGRRLDLPGVCESTNGLASGNNSAEATFHAVCELIERDGGTLWSLLPLDDKLQRCVSPESFHDPLVVDLADRFSRAGVELRLFDQTSDLGIPTVLAVSGPKVPRYSRRFDIATGAGTHPIPARAALRAITEAAQTRVTSISGARDDVRPGAYRTSGAPEAFELLAAQPARRQIATPMAPSAWTAEALLEQTLDQLAAGGVADLVAVDLGAERYGVSVVRVVSDLLEDRGPNSNWRPGPRAIDVLAEAA
jgi:YcaO-like protein with predicted kinase domain